MLDGCGTDAGRMLGGWWSDARRTSDQTVAGVVTVVVAVAVAVTADVVTEHCFALIESQDCY